MKTISMVDLRTDSERIVRDLRRGVRMMLSYRGELLAELVPTASAIKQLTPLEALDLAHKSNADKSAADAQAYLNELRVDQRNWSSRTGR